MSKLNWKKALPWAFYDWANSAYATTVLAGLFPIFLKQYWMPTETAVEVSTFRLGAANSAAGIIVACLAPILGAIADRGGARKRFLMFFAMMGIVMTGALHFVAKGNWMAAVLLYVTATIGFAGANIFYDSLLVNVADEGKLDMVSALGYSMGYLGGGLLFAFNVFMVSNPAKFGFADESEAVRWAFITVMIWWAAFTIPLLLWVKEPKLDSVTVPARQAIAAGLRQLVETFRHIYSLKMVFLFLLAYWLYIDGVDTIILMATDFGTSLGFDSTTLIKALLITQFVGFPAAIAFGKIGERIGARRGILIALCVYLGVTIYGYRTKNSFAFFMR